MERREENCSRMRGKRMNLVIQQPRWFIESRGETTGQERSDGMGNGMGGECVRSGRERKRRVPVGT